MAASAAQLLEVVIAGLVRHGVPRRTFAATVAATAAALCRDGGGSPSHPTSAAGSVPVRGRTGGVEGDAGPAGGPARRRRRRRTRREPKMEVEGATGAAAAAAPVPAGLVVPRFEPEPAGVPPAACPAPAVCGAAGGRALARSPALGGGDPEARHLGNLASVPAALARTLQLAGASGEELADFVGQLALPAPPR